MRTGLFAMGVFSISDSDDSNVFGGCNGQDAPTMRAWNVQAGAGWTSCRSISLARRLFGGGFFDVKNGFAPGSRGVSGAGLALAVRQLPQRCFSALLPT